MPCYRSLMPTTSGGLETPGNEGWLRSARPDAADKFFMVSADGHVQEPGDLLGEPHGARGVPRPAARHRR